MSKILFVTPPYRCWGVQVIGTWPPLHLAYLAGAALAAGHEAEILEAMNHDLTLEDIAEEITRRKPDVVMTLDYLPVTGAIATATVPAALALLATAKSVDPGIVTLIGGPHPSFMYDEILGDPENRVDFVLRGEMEATLVELLAALESGDTSGVDGIASRRDGEVVTTPPRAQVADLDTLAPPAWHLLDWDDYQYGLEPYGRMASVLTSRGCMMGCSFCSQRMFWGGTWRARDPHKVLAEIRHLVETYNVAFVTLIDAYPTKDRDRWELLLDLLIEADLGVHLLMETRVEDIIRDEDILPKYVAAGIVHLYLGAESSSDEMLASLNKGTDVDMNKRAIDLARSNGIVTEASFMVGGPSETPETIKKTIAEAIRLNPDIAVFPVLTPMPFTPIYQEMKDRIEVFDYSQYNLMTPIIKPDAMTRDEVMDWLGRCYMKFYASKMGEMLTMPDGFNKRYLISGYKLMMLDYGEHFTFTGAMPKMPEFMKPKAKRSAG